MPVSSKHLNELLSNQERRRGTVLFAIWPADRRYYGVTLEKLDQTNKTAQVRFEDHTLHECPLSELHLQFLESNPYEAVDDVLCCVCDSDKTSKQNEIVICETCQQGYHQKCHEPKIPGSLLDPEHEDDEWTCSTCTYMVEQHLKKQPKPPLYSSTPRNPKKPKSERQIKLPPTLKTKAFKPEPSEVPKSPEAIEPNENSKSHIAVPMEVISVEQQAKELAKRDDCEPVDKHLSMLAQGLLNRNAEAIQTPDLVDAISAKDPVFEKAPKSIEATKSSQGSKIGAYKSVTKTSSQRTAKTKKTETAVKNQRKNMPIAA